MPARLCKLRFTNLDDYSIFLCIRKNAGPVAQLAEPSAHNRLVPGSSPGRPTSIKKLAFGELFYGDFWTCLSVVENASYPRFAS